MAPYSFPFSFPEDDSSVVRGALELQAPLTNAHNPSEISQYRPGKIHLEGYADLDLCCITTPPRLPSCTCAGNRSTPT